MRRSLRSVLLASGALLAVLVVSATALGEQPTFQIPEGLLVLKAPILAVTCGQAPGAMMLKLICDDAAVGLACEEGDREDHMFTADELAAKCAVQTPCYGVLFVTTGTSLKGMGAAGIDVDYEVARCTALVAKAKELGIFVIVGQIEGPSRRTDETDEKSITSMSPLADLLITRSDVNGDGYFTTLAEEKKIPQIFINQTLDLKVLLPLLFQAR
jgi:hypothetical protein